MIPDFQLGDSVYRGEVEQQVGRRVPVVLGDLIETIYVSPSSPEWMQDVVKSVTRAYGYDFPIRRSDLMTDPLF